MSFCGIYSNARYQSEKNNNNTMEVQILCYLKLETIAILNVGATSLS
jgi:hypothetical protein